MSATVATGFALAIFHTDGVAQVGNPDLVDGDAAGVRAVLDILHAMAGSVHGSLTGKYSAQEEAVSQTFTETSRTSRARG